MNLALQKRNEQLERWRQNEANVELEQQEQKSASIDSNASIQHLKSHTSNQRISSFATNQRESKSLDDCDANTNFILNSSSNKKRSHKQGKSNSDLQVKFSNSTLFLTACTNGDFNECERLLCDKSIDINVTTTDGLTGLHEAAICGNVPMVEFLINHGANVNCCDNEGWTPLHAASSLGQFEVVETLLEYGADVTVVNCENLLAYDLARNEQVQALIGAHLEGVDIDYLRAQEERAIQKDIENWIRTGHYEERSHPVTNATVLHVLAAKGHLKLMKQILESPSLKKQINLEAKDNEGFTPLLAASFWSQTDIVELLIEHGANIFAQANCGYKISSISTRVPNVMSRNPYLAATRPTSSFTRSSRSSKRNEPTSGKGSLLGRSRSSANIGSGLSNSLASSSYGLTSGYTPSTSNWQRSASSTRLNRLSSSETAPSSSYKSSDYTPSSQRSSDKVSNHSHELPRPCILRLSRSNTDENEAKQNADNSRSSEHLKNYQQSRTQQSPTRVQSVQSLDSEDSAYAKRSTTSLDSSATEFSYDESDGIISGSAPRHLKQGQLLKSRSLDVSQQPSADSASPLIGAMSVDRLLLRSESMSERDLRKSYKELVMENERLKRQMRGIDEREKQKQQDWIRKERQLHRKISELEEENRQVEQWKQEIQRLQDENRSLIRVVSKLSKQN